MNYPQVSQVQEADKFQLGYWLRFLPSPGLNYLRSTPDSDIRQDEFVSVANIEKAVLFAIVERFESMGGWDAGISKRVGWRTPK